MSKHSRRGDDSRVPLQVGWGMFLSDRRPTSPRRIVAQGPRNDISRIQTMAGWLQRASGLRCGVLAGWLGCSSSSPPPPPQPAHSSRTLPTFSDQ